MSRWSWWAFGFGAYVAFTLATFPAALPCAGSPRPTSRSPASAGTLWSGQRGELLGRRASRPKRCVGACGRLRCCSAGSRRASRRAFPDGFVAGVITASPCQRCVSASCAAQPRCRPWPHCCPFAACAVKRASRSRTLVLENGWPATIVGELKLAGLETRAPDPRRQRRLGAARRLHGHVRAGAGGRARGAVRRQRRSARGRGHGEPR